MGTFAKVLVTLMIALPMAAYVAGSLIASSADPPERREPVIVRDRDTSPPVAPPPGRDDSDRDRESDGDDRVVDPKPTRIDDDDEDDRDDQDDRDDRDDDSGGGGEDDDDRSDDDGDGDD